MDLCAGSGSWSEPYEKAGYRVQRVTLPESDVRTFRAPSEPVWGVLAAPPCDQFSLARNGHPSPRDFVKGMACVNACLRIVQQVRPRWWALENPTGLLSKWLGTPRDVFEPCDFGDPWTKRTAIWGDFVIPKRGPFVTPLGGGPFCEVCDPSRRKTTWCNDAGHRAVTTPKRPTPKHFRHRWQKCATARNRLSRFDTRERATGARGQAYLPSHAQGPLGPCHTRPLASGALGVIRKMLENTAKSRCPHCSTLCPVVSADLDGTPLVYRCERHGLFQAGDAAAAQSERRPRVAPRRAAHG